MKDCIFCKIVEGKIPCTKVYEDDAVLGFLDIEPHAPVHVLVIPKKHITNLASSTEEDRSVLGDILVAARKIALEKGIDGAYKVTMNSGAEAGQVVMHMHFHLLGGWKNKDEVKSELHE